MQSRGEVRVACLRGTTLSSPTELINKHGSGGSPPILILKIALSSQTSRECAHGMVGGEGALTAVTSPPSLLPSALREARPTSHTGRGSGKPASNPPLVVFTHRPIM